MNVIQYEQIILIEEHTNATFVHSLKSVVVVSRGVPTCMKSNHAVVLSSNVYAIVLLHVYVHKVPSVCDMDTTFSYP
jgi:hypothetical protein